MAGIEKAILESDRGGNVTSEIDTQNILEKVIVIGSLKAYHQLLCKQLEAASRGDWIRLVELLEEARIRQEKLEEVLGRMLSPGPGLEQLAEEERFLMTECWRLYNEIVTQVERQKKKLVQEGEQLLQAWWAVRCYQPNKEEVARCLDNLC